MVPKSHKYLSLPAGKSLDSKFPPTMLTHIGKLLKTTVPPSLEKSFEMEGSLVSFSHTFFFFKQIELAKVFMYPLVVALCSSHII